MLNTIDASELDIQDVIENNLYELQAELAKEGVKVEVDDIQYSFLDRVEELYIKSELIYGSDADIPSCFGVHRGYSGGGMHSHLYLQMIVSLQKILPYSIAMPIGTGFIVYIG
jgi:hypothetical protein